MIKLRKWQYVRKMAWYTRHTSPFDHILDDFEFIWFPTNKPNFFRPVMMSQLRYTRSDRAVRLNRNLRLREREGLK